MPKMVNCSVVKKLMVLGKWPYLMVFGQMTFSLGCLPAASQLASARHLPKPLKITFALSSINCYEVKTPKIVNGRTANVFICLSSINRNTASKCFYYDRIYYLWSETYNAYGKLVCNLYGQSCSLAEFWATNYYAKIQNLPTFHGFCLHL